MYVVIGVVILYAIGYLINQGVSHASPSIPTEVIRIDTMGTPQTITAVIIRDERVYYAPRAGQIVFAVNEGERVRANMHIASIQDSAEVEAINRDMLALDRRAMDIDTMRSDQADPHVIRLNNHIKGQVDNRAHSFTSLNFNDLYTLRDNLNQAINNRNQFIISGGIHAGGDYARQQADLFARLGVHSTNMYARSGGIMTPIIDGLESIFTLAAMETLTREQLSFTPDEIPLFPARDLEANQPAFKTVGNIWYLAAYIPNELIPGFAVGQNRNIYVENPTIGDYVSINMRITHIEPHTRDSRVIFRCTRYVMDFLHKRNANIRITQTVDEGLKIPNSAVATREFFVIPLTYLHGLLEHSVLKYTEEGNVSIPVTATEAGANVHIRMDGTGLALGDILLDGLGGRHILNEIHTIQGVYRANHGFANFRIIHTDELITDRGGSTLLCPIRNSASLREFDSIVVDAGMVSDGQLLW
jgi:hypothetical protein